MKKRDFSHWIYDRGFDGLLLFAQTLEECTFHYSYESYKVSALNCHYLCYDILRTAHDIEKKILMDGNFVPLAEEFEQTINEDIFIKSCIDNVGVVLYAKDKNGKYNDLTKSDLKTKLKHYPEVASFIRDICETNNMYLSTLLEILVSNIFTDTYSYGKRCGFSKRYFLVLVACRHLTCTKTECRKMFLSLIAPLTTIRLNRGKRSNRLPYIFAQGQER